ncbi:MAG: bacteriophage abortive infection AbiH family protein, partial [Clostridiales bacterium]|nr:bacteriophage abortive infection AbiH family protein [Clostridiales bacterium]
ATLDDYKSKNIVDWKINDDVKKELLEAFKHRKYKRKEKNNGKDDIQFITSNKELDELYSHINHNAWLEYFLEYSSYIGENWIDFEYEISKVIQAIDNVRVKNDEYSPIMEIERNRNTILNNIIRASKLTSVDVLQSTNEIDIFINFLDKELNKLIRALEIYISKFVNKIVVKKSVDIEKLELDHVLSFNYSNTYERKYGIGKNIQYEYIHGKADINNTVVSSNLVLGIDEYLNDDRKDKDLEFVSFKKFYQRIYKSTGKRYLDWVDEIKDSYAEYLKKESDVYSGVVESLKDDSISNLLIQKDICTKMKGTEYPAHTLYIFGHSLDVTDKDILKLFICNDNVQTKIFYYRKNEYDKKVLGKLIKNLIKIMGQKELIRRTGGSHKTIEFIPQTINKDKE